MGTDPLLFHWCLTFWILDVSCIASVNPLADCHPHFFLSMIHIILITHHLHSFSHQPCQQSYSIVGHFCFLVFCTLQRVEISCFWSHSPRSWSISREWSQTSLLGCYYIFPNLAGEGAILDGKNEKLQNWWKNQRLILQSDQMHVNSEVVWILITFSIDNYDLLLFL